MESPGATRHKGHEHTVSAKQVRRRLGAMGLLTRNQHCLQPLRSSSIASRLGSYTMPDPASIASTCCLSEASDPYCIARSSAEASWIF